MYVLDKKLLIDFPNQFNKLFLNTEQPINIFLVKNIIILLLKIKFTL